MRHTNREHQESLTRQERIGLWITNHVGTMACAYIFAGIGVGSLVGIFTGNALLGLGVGGFSSYFLQLVLLPVIMVGTNVQSKHDQIREEIAYEVNVKTEKATERIEAALKRIEHGNTKTKKGS